MFKIKKYTKNINAKDFFLLIFLLPLIINPWGYDIYALPKMVFLRIFVSISLLIIIIIFVKRSSLELNFNKYVYIFTGLWLISLIISTIYSIAPNLSFYGSYTRFIGLITHIFFILYFFIAYNLFRDNSFTIKALKFIFWIGIIVSAYAILQKLGVDYLSEQAKEIFVGRSFSTMGHPNFLGQFLLLPLWISLILITKNKGKERLTYSTGFLVLLTALIFTENRASILGLITALSVFFIFQTKFIKLLKYLLAAFSIIAFVLIIIFIAPSSRSIQTRLSMWQSTPEIIKEYPLFGSGLETYKQSFIKVATPDVYKYEHIYSTTGSSHNELIDIAATQGLFGLLIYLSVICGIIYQYFKKKKYNDTALSIAFYCLISIFISKLFGFSTIVDWIVFHTLLAIFSVKLLPINKKIININTKTVFVSGVIFILLLTNIFYASKILVADIYLDKGFEQFESGEYEESISSLLKFNSLNPKQDKGSYLTASIYNMLPGKSINSDISYKVEYYANQGGKFTNYDYSYHIQKARFLTTQNRFDEAELHLQEAQNLAQNYPLLYKEWTFKYYEEEDYESAVEKGEKFLEITPDYWKWKKDLNERNEEEKNEYRIFFKTTPNFNDIFVHLSESYKTLGLQKKAEFYSFYK